MSEEYDLKKLYAWLVDEKRKPALTHFTAGLARMIAHEIEFQFYTRNTVIKALEDKIELLEIDINELNNRDE